MTHSTYIQPNGEWAVYSTVAEEFVLEDATREEVLEFYLSQERREIERMLDGVEDGSHRTRLSYEEAVEQSQWDD